MRYAFFGMAVVLAGMAAPLAAAERSAKKPPREALQAFNDLIGGWKGTGTPEGTREQKERGLWTESLNWRWQFKGEDAWLQVSFAGGKYFRKGELRYLPGEGAFRLTVLTPAGEKLAFTGRLNGRRLVLSRTDEKVKEEQRLTISLLHFNRFLYSYAVKPKDQPLFTRVYQVGARKKGVPFATSGDAQPECVVSGGLGTMKVSYQGKTYYVCCSGCRAEFEANPEKYIKEYEARRAKKTDKNK